MVDPTVKPSLNSDVVQWRDGPPDTGGETVSIMTTDYPTDHDSEPFANRDDLNAFDPDRPVDAYYH